MIRPPPISTRTHTPFPYTPRFPSTSRSTRRVAPPPTGSTATIRSNGSRNGWRNRKPGQKVEAFPSPLTDKKGRRAPPFTLAKSRLWQGHGLSLPLPRAAAALILPLTLAGAPALAQTNVKEDSVVLQPDRKSTRLNSSHSCAP